MLRVLHVLEALRGGTSRHVADVVRAAVGVAPCDIDHHVVLPRAERAASASGAVVDAEALAAMEAHGATVHRLDMRRSVTHPANPVAAARLIGLTRRVRPAILHGHSSVGGALARLAGPPTRVPVVYTPHGIGTGAATVGIERLLGRATAALIALSPSEADLARRLRLVDPARIRVIPNGIDLHPVLPAGVADLRSRLGLAPGTPLVGTVTRLVDQKAPADFVAVCADVVARRPDAHGLLIGMGPLQYAVDQAVAREGLSGRFHQIHHLLDAWAVLDQLDVFVLASRFEGGPYTPLEAMRAGVPVVLSDVVGNRDAVVTGVSGVLCGFGDTDGMARAVVDLLGDPDRRALLAGAARARLRGRFGLDAMGRALSELYGELHRAQPSG